ncbi:MAG: NAD(P)-dependent alcohol dehydrogenase [Aristaeellaceae bacterium]|nr:NAD(P)-dependent alcohol dehydrogenase [Eubacteriales bacterium]
MSNKAFYMTALETMEEREAPMPVVAPDQVLIRIKAVGICGSDLHYYSKGNIGNYIVKPPFILGHEAAGEVVAVGEKVSKLKVGDRVCMEPGIPCMACEECLTGHYNLCKELTFWATPPYDGCLCEYVAHPAAFCFKLPDNMSFVEGALVEPLAVGLHACNRGEVQLGHTVAILGSGCIGLVSLLAAKARGATKVIIGDVIDKRLEKAAELGGITVNTSREDFADRVMELTDGRGADVVLDCAGFCETVHQGLRAVKIGGTIVLVGLGADRLNDLDTGIMNVKEVTIKALNRYRNVYQTAVNAISEGVIDVKQLVSHSFKFDDTIEAYATCLRDIRNVVKGVIEY